MSHLKNWILLGQHWALSQPQELLSFYDTKKAQKKCDPQRFESLKVFKINKDVCELLHQSDQGQAQAASLEFEFLPKSESPKVERVSISESSNWARPSPLHIHSIMATCLSGETRDLPENVNFCESKELFNASINRCFIRIILIINPSSTLQYHYHHHH